MLRAIVVKGIPSWAKVAIRHSYRAMREFSFLMFFSFMPIWLGALAHFVLAQSVTGYLEGFLRNGEGLILAATTVGPLMYTLANVDNLARHRHFPLRWLYYLSVTGICVVAALVVGVKSTPQGAIFLSPLAVQSVSIVVSVLAIILWFAIVGTSAAQETGAADIMRQDEADFVAGYEAN